MNRRYAACVLALAFAGCSSTASSVNGTRFIPQRDAGQRADSTRTASLKFVVRIPRRHRHRRSPHYISAGTKAMILVAQPSTGTAVRGFVNITPSSPSCSGAPLETLKCTLQIVVKTGSYTVTVSAYDATQASAGGTPAGHLLSTNSVVANVTPGEANSIPLTLDAIPASVTLSPGSGQTNVADDGTGELRALGGASSTLLAIAHDADGYAIVGPGSPALSLKATNAGGGITVAPASNGNPNAFTLHSTGLGNALLVATATPGKGSPVSSNVSVTTTFTTSFLAGQVYNPGSNDGTGANAQFANPEGIAYDPDDGNLYVADTLNCTIRQVTTGGVVSTIAGVAGNCDKNGNDLQFPIGITYDHDDGDLYVADNDNCTIDRVPTASSSDTFGRVAGTLGTCNSSNLDFPIDVVYAGNQKLYVSDEFNCVIRQITGVDSTPSMTTFAGTLGACNETGSDLKYPAGIAYDGTGTLYVADSTGCVLHKIVVSGPTVSTLAGSACGNADGTGSSASFQTGILTLAYDTADGAIYVPDSTNCEIRRVTTAGEVKTLFGNPYACSYQEGTLIVPAYTHHNVGIVYVPGAIGTPGTMYFSDTRDYVIRRLNP